MMMGFSAEDVTISVGDFSTDSVVMVNDFKIYERKSIGITCEYGKSLSKEHETLIRSLSKGCSLKVNDQEYVVEVADHSDDSSYLGLRIAK